MENLRRVVLFVLIASALASCGVRQPFQLGHAASPGEGSSTNPVFVEGALALPGGSSFSFIQNREKPLVMIFASDTCDVCLAEALGFRQALKNGAVEPGSVRLVTAMVGVGEADAAEWKRANQIPWSVGWDENLSLYGAWCEGTTVPCTIVQLPEKGVVFRHKGGITAAQIQEWTGPWEAIR